MFENKFYRTITAVVSSVSILLGSATLIQADGSKPTTNYKTQVLEPMDINIRATTNLNVVYPVMTEVKYEANYSNATFVSYVAENGDYVMEGDPILRIETSIDEIDLIEAKMELERAREQYDNFQSEAANSRKNAQKAVDEATKKKERKIALLQQEQNEAGLISQEQNLSEWIANLSEKIEKMESESVTEMVVAPANGQVYFWRNQFLPGDSIHSNQTICYLLETDYAIFSIDNSAHLFRYGMEMLITDENGMTYKGHIGSCDSDMLSAPLISESAYVIADEAIPQDQYEKLSASFESIHMEQVITVPTGAYHNDDHGFYVNVLTEAGSIMKHYFTQGRILTNYCVALDGLTPGMTIILN